MEYQIKTSITLCSLKWSDNDVVNDMTKIENNDVEILDISSIRLQSLFKEILGGEGPLFKSM